MKKLLLLSVAALILTHGAYAKPADEWQVKTTERQFGEVTSVVEQVAGSQPSVMSKAANRQQDTGVDNLNAKENKVTAFSRTLNARPQVNTLDQRFWLYDAKVFLNGDIDGDGFYNYFTIEFDADTEYSHAEVYARLYLARGEVFKEFHTTSNFNIYSDRDDDVFVVESELLSGFRPADYEVLIELYDAHTNQLVATLDGLTDADLYLLPLESNDHEDIYVEQVVVVHESGGSMGWLSLLLIPLFAIRRFIRKS